MDEAALAAAWTSEGRLAGSAGVSEPGNKTPPRAIAFRTLSAPGAARGEAEKKGTGQVMESGQCTGLKRSFAPRQRISIIDYQHSKNKNRKR